MVNCGTWTTFFHICVYMTKKKNTFWNWQSVDGPYSLLLANNKEWGETKVIQDISSVRTYQIWLFCILKVRCNLFCQELKEVTNTATIISMLEIWSYSQLVIFLQQSRKQGLDCHLHSSLFKTTYLLCSNITDPQKITHWFHTGFCFRPCLGLVQELPVKLTSAWGLQARDWRLQKVTLPNQETVWHKPLIKPQQLYTLIFIEMFPC